jgi:ABC-type transport system involved in cytochrome c biogenesis ATPase subunit
MRRPSIWLLDEPIAALDTAARIFLQGILEDALAKGACVILSAHDNSMELRAPVSRLTIVGGRIERGESS